MFFILSLFPLCCVFYVINIVALAVQIKCIIIFIITTDD